MKNFISIENNAVLKNNDRFRNNYKNVKNMFFIKVIPIIIFFYQLLLIWIPSISAKMLRN